MSITPAEQGRRSRRQPVRQLVRRLIHELAADAGPGPAGQVDLGRNLRPKGESPARPAIPRPPRADRLGAVAAVVLITVAAFWLNAAFAFAISRPGSPDLRTGFGRARGHVRTVADRVPASAGAGQCHHAGPAVGPGLVRAPARGRPARHDGVLRRGARPHRRQADRQAGREGAIRARREAGRARRHGPVRSESCARRRMSSPGSAWLCSAPASPSGGAARHRADAGSRGRRRSRPPQTSGGRAPSGMDGSGTDPRRAAVPADWPAPTRPRDRRSPRSIRLGGRPACCRRDLV
jgi:hypothetical protein